MFWIQSEPNRQSYGSFRRSTPMNYPRTVESEAPAMATPLELVRTPLTITIPVNKYSRYRGTYKRGEYLQGATMRKPGTSPPPPLPTLNCNHAKTGYKPPRTHPPRKYSVRAVYCQINHTLLVVAFYYEQGRADNRGEVRRRKQQRQF
jgi:hypothetical protein